MFVNVLTYVKCSLLLFKIMSIFTIYQTWKVENILTQIILKNTKAITNTKDIRTKSLDVRYGMPTSISIYDVCTKSD